jgi:hypothetical protein
MGREEMALLIKQGLAIEEVLQAVEDALVDARYDDLVIATERGIFHWQTIERARAETDWRVADDLEH